MITAGIDLGAGTVKVVLLEDSTDIVATSLDKTGGRPLEAAQKLLKEVLAAESLKTSDVGYLSTTGFSRYLYPDRDLQLSDITTNARGAIFLFPATTTVIDIGTQSSRAISITETGKVQKFKFTEKCAAGAGRFIERCSKYLQLPLPELSRTAMESTDPQMISSVCAVLAETEIINHIATETPISDIVMGVFMSISSRAMTLLRRVGLKPELTLTGGLVNNPGMIKALEQTTGIDINVVQQGHHAGALGAAMLGHRRLQQLRAKSAA